jgi:nicotinamidase-related amidase
MAALLILDVQRYFSGGAAAHVPPLVEALQNRYKIVFATVFVNREGSPYGRLIGWRSCMPGSSDVELAFKPAPHVMLIEKHVYTVVDAKFLAMLAGAGVSEVHICGLDTEACVAKCAVDLFEAGIRPVVLAKACASHAGANFHRDGLKILARIIGEKQIDFS